MFKWGISDITKSILLLCGKKHSRRAEILKRKWCVNKERWVMLSPDRFWFCSSLHPFYLLRLIIFYCFESFLWWISALHWETSPACEGTWFYTGGKYLGQFTEVGRVVPVCKQYDTTELSETLIYLKPARSRSGFRGILVGMSLKAFVQCNLIARRLMARLPHWTLCKSQQIMLWWAQQIVVLSTVFNFPLPPGKPCPRWNATAGPEFAHLELTLLVFFFIYFYFYFFKGKSPRQSLGANPYWWNMGHQSPIPVSDLSCVSC